MGEPKKRLARLIEAWADEHCVDLTGIGIWRGAEGYLVGPKAVPVAHTPDVVITDGSLAAYAGVCEIWRYDGQLTLWALKETEYREVPRSRCLAGLEVALVARCMYSSTQREALAMLRASFFSRMGRGYCP